MSFRRTDSGLSRMHLFLGVDAVVFVEGGKATFSLEEVKNGSYSSQADDLKYWQILFAKFAPTRTVHLRAVGSKNTIKELALLVASGSVTHVLAAMDRDLDHVNSSIPSAPGVFHTVGYSWENDVWSDAVVFATFKKFNTVPEAEKAAEREIQEQFCSLRKRMRHCVRVDVLLVSNAEKPLHRETLKKVILPVKKAPPSYNPKTARTLIRECRQKTRPKRLFRGKTAVDTLADCYGHLLEQFGYHLLVHLLSKYCKLRVTPRELLVPAAIDAFSQRLTTDARLTQHFTPLFDRVSWN